MKTQARIFLPLFEEIAKISKAKITIEKDGHSDKIAKAIKEFEKERKNSKTGKYKNIEEFQKAMKS